MSDRDKEQEKESSVQDSKKRKLDESSPISIPSTSNVAANLPLWVAGGSPAKFCTQNELLNLSKELENLALVHEIAIDPSFSIPETPEDPIRSSVQDSMRRAFWDLLRKDLTTSPPSYTNAFNLLLEIKEIILTDILTDQHVRLKSEIQHRIDEETLRAKLEQDSFHVEPIARFILDFLSRLCSPARDATIENIKKETGIVELLRGIMELLDVMKVDMTNYTISVNRAAVEKHSEKLELQVFLKLLEQDPGGADLTKKWIADAFLEVFPPVTEESVKREKIDNDDKDELTKTTSKGYVNLIISENPSPFPETLQIDKLRLRSLAEKYLQVSIVTTAIFVTSNIAGKDIAQSEGFKDQVKRNLIAISNDIEEKTLNETVDGIAEQCVKDLKEASEKLQKEFTEEQQQVLRSQIKTIKEPTQSVRQLVEKRISNFIEGVLRAPTSPQRLLPGLSVVQSELYAFISKFLRICLHNRKTYETFYAKVLEELKNSSPPE
ncbi:unnamed protein product [Auanema sp. JU1783]|nr:unnamed protein product [Auanema sp. JU1783]